MVPGSDTVEYRADQPLLHGIPGSWRRVKPNAETGEGYSDISIQTPDRVGIVIELKYADDGNLEAASWETLRQIEEKKYAEGLKRWGRKRFLSMASPFMKKNVWL